MARMITLDGAHVLLVDDDVARMLLGYRLYMDARTRHRPRVFLYDRSRGHDFWPRRAYLERLITGAAKGQWVQFKNDNTLDCRRQNLKIVSHRREVLDTPARQNHQRQKCENSLVAL
jgi:hypothetical protein